MNDDPYSHGGVDSLGGEPVEAEQDTVRGGRGEGRGQCT